MNVERGKEMVEIASLIGIVIVAPVGAEMEGAYLMLPWALVILACMAGEVLVVAQGGGERGSTMCSCAAVIVRLLVIGGLTYFFPLAYSGGTWWLMM